MTCILFQFTIYSTSKCQSIFIVRQEKSVHKKSSIPSILANFICNVFGYSLVDPATILSFPLPNCWEGQPYLWYGGRTCIKAILQWTNWQQDNKLIQTPYPCFIILGATSRLYGQQTDTSWSSIGASEQTSIMQRSFPLSFLNHKMDIWLPEQVRLAVRVLGLPHHANTAIIRDRRISQHCCWKFRCVGTWSSVFGSEVHDISKNRSAFETSEWLTLKMKVL